MSDNVWYVVVASNVGPTTILDGVTIRDGGGTGPGLFGAPANGGGIYMSHASPTIANVTLFNNKAEQMGERSTFIQEPATHQRRDHSNSTGLNGGGIYSEVTCTTASAAGLRSPHQRSPRIRFGLFGGGLYNNAGSPQLSNVLFQGHTPPKLAGSAIHLSKGSATIADTQFIGNYGAMVRAV